MGKQKYISVRKANRSSKFANFIPYAELSKFINEVDIGHVYNINPQFTGGLEDDEIGDGMYRNVLECAPRLAKFYLTVNEHRDDKMKSFSADASICYVKKDPTSYLFVMAFGGDEAPGSGTAFLLSFLNIGKRIASSFENFFFT